MPGPVTVSTRSGYRPDVERPVYQVTTGGGKGSDYNPYGAPFGVFAPEGARVATDTVERQKGNPLYSLYEWGGKQEQGLSPYAQRLLKKYSAAPTSLTQEEFDQVLELQQADPMIRYSTKGQGRSAAEGGWAAAFDKLQRGEGLGEAQTALEQRSFANRLMRTYEDENARRQQEMEAQQAVRQRQLAQADYLEEVMRGEAGPSLGELQLQQGLETALAQQHGAAFARPGAAPGLAARQSAMVGQQLQGNVNQQAAQLRAAEQAQARQEFGAALASARGQDAQFSGLTAGLIGQQGGQAGQMYQGLGNQAVQSQGQNLQYQLGMNQLDFARSQGINPYLAGFMNMGSQVAGKLAEKYAGQNF